MTEPNSQSDLKVEVTVPTHTRYLGLVGCIGEELAKRLDCYSGNREALAFHLNLVLTEAVTNAIEHAACNPAATKVRITMLVRDDELCIRVYDKGLGFDIEALPVPDPDHPSEGGFGIYCIKKLMDSVQYHRTESGNILEMRKRLG